MLTTTLGWKNLKERGLEILIPGSLSSQLLFDKRKYVTGDGRESQEKDTLEMQGQLLHVFGMGVKKVVLPV